MSKDSYHIIFLMKILESLFLPELLLLKRYKPLSRSSFYLLFFIFFGLTLNINTVSAQEQETDSPRILVLNSYHHGYVWSDQEFEGLREAIGRRAEIVLEYMDTKRVPSEAYRDALLELYARKYTDAHFDVLVALDDIAFRFALKYRDIIFPDTPVVFSGVNFLEPDQLEAYTNVTGVVEHIDMEGTIQAGLQVYPQAVRILAITDKTQSGQENREHLEMLVRTGRIPVPVIFLDQGQGLTIAEVNGILEKAPAESLVYYADFYIDRHGRYVDMHEHLPQLAAISNAPIVVHSDMSLGMGTLGGKILTGYSMGEAAGQMVLQILRGKPADEIPVLWQPEAHHIFDYEQLSRWGIPLSGLPEGSRLVNLPEPTFYQQYTDLIWTVIGIFLILLGFIAILILNILYRRRAQKALQQSEQQYRSLVEKSPEPVFVHYEGAFHYVNPRAVQLFGAERAEDLIGKSLNPFFRGNRFWDHLPDPKNTERLMPLQTSEEQVLRIRRLDGEGAEVEISEMNISFDGKPARLAICRDVTERRKREREEREFEEQIRHTQKLESLGVLAGGIAHDFNNFLMAILGNSDLALDELPPQASAKSSLLEIQKAAIRASELCRQLLAYSGKGKSSLEKVDLSTLVKEISEMLEVSISKKVHIHYQLSNTIPFIEVDATQVRQVVMNLIVNASEAIGDQEGAIILKTGLYEGHREEAAIFPFPAEGRPEPGQYCYVEVRDTGSGISIEAAEKLFEPFYTTKLRGRGLGLSAVLGIVKGHQGMIQLESEPGRGATFRVLFPAEKEQALEKPLEKEIPPDKPVEKAGRERILVVDDEDQVREVCRMMLKSIGFEVTTACEGKEALDIMLDSPEPFNCVVLDLMMPQLDGQECFQEIRRRYRTLPVVMMSGFTEMEITRRFEGTVAPIFLQKPFLRDDLLSSVRQALQQVSSSPQSTG
jgi:PAS domain S-box-containing protein